MDVQSGTLPAWAQGGPMQRRSTRHGPGLVLRGHATAGRAAQKMCQLRVGVAAHARRSVTGGARSDHACNV